MAMVSKSRNYRERLIDEVKKCPVLYDTRHEHHRDIDVRDRCWNEIAARLDANSEVLKHEWKILRDSLRQSLKKSGGGAKTKSGVPCKKWRFAARMAFLVPYMTRRNPRHSLREDVKLDMETDASEVGEAEEWAGAGGAGVGTDTDALDLFFAAVCASARRLPAPQLRALKRSVLDALLLAEAHAEAAPAPQQPSSTFANDYQQQNDGHVFASGNSIC